MTIFHICPDAELVALVLGGSFIGQAHKRILTVLIIPLIIAHWFWGDCRYNMWRSSLSVLCKNSLLIRTTCFSLEIIHCSDNLQYLFTLLQYTLLLQIDTVCMYNEAFLDFSCSRRCSHSDSCHLVANIGNHHETIIICLYNKYTALYDGKTCLRGTAEKCCCWVLNIFSRCRM